MLEPQPAFHCAGGEVQSLFESGSQRGSFLTDVEEGCPCSEEVCHALKGSVVSSLVLSRTRYMTCGSFHSVPAFLRSPSCGWSKWKSFQRREKNLKTPSKWNQLVVDARKAMRWPLSGFLEVGLGDRERWEREKAGWGSYWGVHTLLLQKGHCPDWLWSTRHKSCLGRGTLAETLPLSNCL